jgi:hypothetical protein
MDKTQKAANHAPRRDYPQEVGMESRGKAGEQSYAKAETEGEDKSYQLSTLRTAVCRTARTVV